MNPNEKREMLVKNLPSMGTCFESVPEGLVHEFMQREEFEKHRMSGEFWKYIDSLIRQYSGIGVPVALSYVILALDAYNKGYTRGLDDGWDSAKGED